MMESEIINISRNIVVAQCIEVAAKWLPRFIGLMGRTELLPNHCLVLYPCNSIHTCFMKFNIDVLFVNEEGLIIHIAENMPPFRFSPIIRGARFVLELPAYTVKSTGTSLNDRLNLVPEAIR